MKVDVLGVRVDSLKFEEALVRIESFVSDGRQHLITTPYSESIVAAQKDTEFRRIINGSDLAVPDGGGLLAAAEFLGYTFPRDRFLRVLLAVFSGLKVGLKLLFRPKSFRVIGERVSGTDLVVALCRLAAQKGYRVYLLGGFGAVADKVSEKLKGEIPSLSVASSPGPQNLSGASAAEIEKEIKKINEFQPDLLFVAFKPVAQEKWLEQNRGRIRARVLMAVGGAFEMMAGAKPRAPRLLRRLNLEWLWRLLLEPSRLKRIYTAVIVFPWLVFSHKVRSGPSTLRPGSG